MKMKKTALVALLCLVLCVSLLPVSAFADQTVIIIGGAIKQETSDAQGTSVVTNSTAGTVVADSGSSNVIVGGSGAVPAASMIVMPNGTVVTQQSSSAAVATDTAAQTQAAVTKPTTISPDGLAGEIYKRINAERLAKGLGILGYDTQLQATADLRAKESASVFGHTRPDGSAAVTAVTVEYNVAGENLIQVTKEFANVDIIVETWLNSQTHKANIMLADFSQTAIGIYESNGTLFISQIFTD